MAQRYIMVRQHMAACARRQLYREDVAWRSSEVIAA